MPIYSLLAIKNPLLRNRLPSFSPISSLNCLITLNYTLLINPMNMSLKASFRASFTVFQGWKVIISRIVSLVKGKLAFYPIKSLNPILRT